MTRIASSLVIAVLFLSLFAFAFNVQTARAQSGTIIINPDGTISSPVPANITTSDNITYAFTGNNYLPIAVNRSNIIINGMGHTLQAPAPGGIGFSLTGVSNVTIKNTTITNSVWGIYLVGSSGNTLSGNNITANSLGIYLLGSSGNTLSGNNITANSDHGICLYDSSDSNTLSSNNITANGGYGIWLDSSSGNVLSGNVMTNNGYNFFVFGFTLSSFVNYIDASNLVDGKSLYYLMNRSNIVISPKTYPAGVGYLGLVNCKNVTVQGLTLTNNGQGLLLENTNDSKITDNNVTANSDDGIDLFFSSGNVLCGNNVTANSNGIYLYYSSGNTLSGNNITANIDDGVDLQFYSDSNTLSSNNVTANSEGICLEYSSDNVLSGNNATANGDGIDLYYSSDSNALSSNNVTANSCGIALSSSSGNTFFHNNFINNTQQVSGDGSPNTWDNGYPSGGNYWSDYQTRYPNAVEIDDSGIWNTSYVINANNTDQYPLMQPWFTQTSIPVGQTTIPVGQYATLSEIPVPPPTIPIHGGFYVFYNVGWDVDGNVSGGPINIYVLNYSNYRAFSNGQKYSVFQQLLDVSGPFNISVIFPNNGPNGTYVFPQGYSAAYSWWMVFENRAGSSTATLYVSNNENTGHYRFVNSPPPPPSFSLSSIILYVLAAVIIIAVAVSAVILRRRRNQIQTHAALPAFPVSIIECPCPSSAHFSYVVVLVSQRIKFRNFVRALGQRLSF